MKEIIEWWRKPTKQRDAWLGVLVGAMVVSTSMRMFVWAGSRPNIATGAFVALYSLASLMLFAKYIVNLVRAERDDGDT